MLAWRISLICSIVLCLAGCNRSPYETSDDTCYIPIRGTFPRTSLTVGDTVQIIAVIKACALVTFRPPLRWRDDGTGVLNLEALNDSATQVIGANAGTADAFLWSNFARGDSGRIESLTFTVEAPTVMGFSGPVRSTEALVNALPERPDRTQHSGR
jgi:hypothetical protein